MRISEVTFEEEQEIKRLSIKHGLDIPWTAEGKIDPGFVAGLRLGGLVGKAIGFGATPTQLNTVLEPLLTFKSYNKGTAK